VRLNARVESLTSDADGVACALSEDEEICFERAIVCIGRKANTAGIGLDRIGLTDGGPLSVNERMETAIPHIYAIGDITNKMMLAHVASRQGVVAAENAAGADVRMEYHAVPSCVFSSPEVFGVGLTEEVAREQGERRWADRGRAGHRASRHHFGRRSRVGDPAGNHGGGFRQNYPSPSHALRIAP
jgi:dihydrolipoamide dehydrogenase